MPIVREWNSHESVLYLQLVGEITLDEMYEQDALTQRLLQETGVSLYVMADASQITNFPMSLSDHYALWGRQMSPQVQLLVIYGIRLPLAALLATIIARVSRGRCQIVPTYDEAKRLVHQYKQAQSSAYLTV